MFQPGLNELVVGKNASKTYQGLTVGNKIDFAGGHWDVVGVFDAGGSAFDSEVWCDSQIFNQVLKRPANIFQSATVHLASPATYQEFKDAVTSDPRMNVDVYREIDYYAKQSTTMTRLITVLGGLVAAIMAIGAIFGALNTMYSAVAERGREIATMRAVGFSSWNVILSFLFEALSDFVPWRDHRLPGGFAAQRPHHQHDEFPDLLQRSLRLQNHLRSSGDGCSVRSGDGCSRWVAARYSRRSSASLRSPAGTLILQCGGSRPRWRAHRFHGPSHSTCRESPAKTPSPQSAASLDHNRNIAPTSGAPQSR